MPRNGDDPACERCGDPIGKFEPATSVRFNGGVDSGTLVICHGCAKDLTDWWNEGEAVEDDPEPVTDGGQDTRYGHLTKDHEWAEPKPDAEPDPRPRVEVDTHTVTIDRYVDEDYIDRYRWRFAIEDRTIVGWTRSDIEPNGTEDYTNDRTWKTMPESVRDALGEALGIDDWSGHLDLPAHLREGEDGE